MTPEVARAFNAYEDMRNHLGGCTDGGCIIKKPQGMHTNGGCKCNTDKLKMQRMVLAANNLYQAIYDEVAKGIK